MAAHRRFGRVGIVVFQRRQDLFMLLNQAVRRRDLAQRQKTHAVHRRFDILYRLPRQQAVDTLGNQAVKLIVEAEKRLAVMAIGGHFL